MEPLMLEPLRRNARKRSVKTTRSVKAPIKGWSDRAVTDVLGAEYAGVLENFIPEEDGVTVRPGYESHATGIAASVVRLMSYEAGAINKIFASTGNSVFEVTTAGAVGAADLSSLTNGMWSSTMFSTSGGNFLVMCNGADGVRSYNGTTWATQTINNVSASSLVYVTQHKERLWFIEENTLDAWFLDVLNISGDATRLPLGSVFERGGTLKTIFTWSRDGGAGLDDFLVFMTDQGEAALYQGTNPASATDWALVGVFNLDQPLSRECWTKTGADVLILTRSGTISMTAAFTTEDIVKAAPKDVRKSFRAAADSGAAIDGWQMLHNTRRGWFFANVPVVNQIQYDQYLVNAIGGKWCKLVDIPSTCWGSLDGTMYFGDPNGNVFKAFDSLNDAGSNIVARLITGYDRFGTGNKKDFKSLKVYMRSEADPTPLIEMRADFDTRNSTASASSFSLDSGAVWDVALWDVAEWTPDPSAVQKWFGVGASGAVGAVYLQVETKNATFSILGYDVNYEVGDSF